MELIEAINESKKIGNLKDAAICRVCLATNVKMFDLFELELWSSFEEFFDLPVTLPDILPKYICMYCHSTLKRSLNFQYIGQQTQSFILSICKKKENVTPQKILNHRESVKKLYQNLSININGTIFEIIDDTQKETMDNENLNLNIKIEDLDFCHSNTDDTLIPNDDFINGNITYKENCDEKIPVKDMKYQHKKVNSKKNLDKRGCRKKKFEKRKVKKNKYNQKFEEDFVLFSKMYNVDVVFLNKEQQLELINKRKEILEREHSNKYRFACKVCYKGFLTENAYKRHIISHDPIRGEYSCDICQNRYPTKEQLQSHVRQHRIEFICKLCGRVNRNSSSAKLHHKWHQGTKFECQFCFKKFNAQSTKLNHVREQHSLVSCDICQLSFKGTLALTRHRLGHHGNMQTVQCPSCGVQFRDQLAYFTHKTGNGCDVALKTCSVCGDSFKNELDLNRHNLEKHENVTFKCTECSASFATDRGLGIHWTRTHLTTDKQTNTSNCILCEICAKSFDSRVKYKYHLRIHSGEKPHKCNECQKTFRLPQQLKVHTNTHTGDKPIKCRLCTETFKSYSQRYKHKLMVHIKERPHKCSMCDKSYVVSFDLKTHVKFAHMHLPRPPRHRHTKIDKSLQK